MFVPWPLTLVSHLPTSPTSSRSTLTSRTRALFARVEPGVCRIRILGFSLQHTGVGKGVFREGKGGVHFRESEGLPLICKLSPLSSDATYQQRGLPGFQSEPGAGMRWGRQSREGATGCRGRCSGPQFVVPSPALSQATTEHVHKAGRLLHRHLLATYPTLIRDRKYHLRLYR